MSEVTYEVVKKFGTISVNKDGWTKELNLVSWNGFKPKYDLREWSPDHTQMGKGLTFTQREIEDLADLLNVSLDQDEVEEDAGHLHKV
jgi:hypothetical protein